MRIAFVSSHAKQGGSERYLAALLRGLPPALARDVIVLEDGPLVAELVAAGFPPKVVPVGSRADQIVRSARVLRRELARRRPDAIHANGVKAAMVSILATLGTRIPVVWVKHDFSWDGALARLVASRCRLVVGVSEAVLVGLPRARRQVISPGLPLPTTDVEASRDAVDRLAPSRPVIALIGRFHPVRGHRELIAALPDVLRRRPNTTLLLAGADDASQPGYRAALLQDIDEAGLADRVVVLGHRDDAMALIAGADAVALPTVRDERGMGEEGFGLVAVEALSVGTPVVGYRSGALPEVVGDCGRLVDSGDRAGLASALVDVLDPAVASGLRACGPARVQQLFSEERWLAEMEACYAAITARRGSPGNRPSHRPALRRSR